ncbi:MAG: prepilin-type N-terminal cleavage/methylation domain-containing protein [Deltaproteobacteria bacterium]|nr:prepilin-type N-terminal cleavage/methylation domain-containing protein [Deltaproteobacteria bacterium]
MKTALTGEKGFTLIEILMAIVIIGIVSAVAGMMIYEGARSFGAMDARSELSADGLLAVERASRELRLVRCTASGNSCAPQAADITAWTASEVRFVNTLSEGRGLRLDAGALKLRQGSIAVDPEDALANNVSALSFEYLKTDGSAASAVSDIWIINMNLTLTSGAESLDLKASIHPRSFNK